MITIEQIKAARGLLDWNQDDLAKHTHISKNAINNLERRVVMPRLNTLNAIQHAFEEAGVEFLEGIGVRLMGNVLQVKMFEGKDSVYRLWNDMLDSLKKGDERLITGVNEAKFIQGPVEKERFDVMAEKFIKYGIKGRKLSLHGDTAFLDSSSEYRWVNNEQFSKIPMCIYANKFTINIYEPVQRILVIENATIAESFRSYFNNLWKSAKIPPAYVYNKRPEA